MNNVRQETDEHLELKRGWEVEDRYELFISYPELITGKLE